MKKLVIVTGASSGIGWATAHHLQKKGYQVVCLARNEEKLLRLREELKNDDVWSYPIDISRPQEIRKFFENAVIPWENLYGLVNCAGISVGSDIFSLRLEDWELDMAVNLRAPFLFIQGVVQKLESGKKPGSIVNISSLAGVTGAKKPNYSSSKAALFGLTKSVAQQCGRLGIRVNVIYPGAVKTPMTADWDEEKVSMIVKNTPLGRMAEPKDISSVIEWLLSDDSSFITGASINATGGQYVGQ